MKQVWDINCQKTLLLWEAKEHKKAVTCFVLSESGDSIISGSSDKTIRVSDRIILFDEGLDLIRKTANDFLYSYGKWHRGNWSASK